MVQYFPIVTGSLTVTGSINVSGGITASGGISISGSIASASFASTASFVALAQSASNAVAAATASFANAFTVAGNLTAQTLVVQTITSSVDFVTGSTRFGSIAANTHVFTGSMSVTGSGTFASNVIASSGFEVPNGQFYRARRTDSNLLTDMIGIPSGTNDVRILTTGGLNVINGSLATMLGIADNGAATFTSSTFNVATFNSTYGQMSIGFANSGTAFAYIGSGNSVTSDGASNDDLGIGTGGLNKSIIFATGAGYARRMTITSGGNVGIGIAAPDYKLDVNGVTQIRDTLLTTKQVGFFYAQTSTSGTTSLVNTGIFYNTSITGFSNNGTYLLVVTGNPNALGSNEYRAVYLGYITINTGYDFGITNVVQRISYTQIVAADAFNIGTLTISAVFWNGTTETTQQVNGTTNNQIRIKITGYNSSAIGAAQEVRLTKIVG